MKSKQAQNGGLNFGNCSVLGMSSFHRSFQEQIYYFDISNFMVFLKENSIRWTALFRVITQLVVAIYYRRFGTIYRSNFQGTRIFLTFEDRIDRWSRNVGEKLPLLSCVITQKSAVLICFGAEAWNYTRFDSGNTKPAMNISQPMSLSINYFPKVLLSVNIY